MTYEYSVLIIFTLSYTTAEEGKIWAMYTLGMNYRDGDYGFDKNLPEALKYIRMAAERGYAKAQCDLGYMYSKGEGVPQDMKKAFDLYMQAAVQGLATAQYNVGNAYYGGEGVDKDVNQSFIWYKKAAEQGYTFAQYNLGNSVKLIIIDVLYVHVYTYHYRIIILSWCRDSNRYG